MSRSSKTEKAREAVAMLFEKLNVTKVVYVDDAFVDELPVDAIIGKLAEAYQKSPGEVKGLLPQVRFDVPTRRIWAEKFTEQWKALSADEQRELSIKIDKIRNGATTTDAETIDNLALLFADIVPLEKLSPSKWIDNQKVLLRDISAKSRILLLFDHDLRNDEGFSSGGSLSGMGLIQQLLAELGDVEQEAVFCGLLTHTIADIDGEFSRWRELETEYKVPLHKFLPLAKVRLGNPDLQVFVDGLKKAALNTFCEKLKDQGLKVIEQAHTLAHQELSNLEVYDFDQIVIQSSWTEGVWEAETFLRLFNLLQSEHIHQLLTSTDSSHIFNETVLAARAINEIKTIPPDLGYVSRLRRRELYQTGNLIIHTPLQTGDVFENNAEKVFILLAQPCDLMVRKTGERTIERLFVPLVHIEGGRKYDGKHHKEEGQTLGTLPYFKPDSSDVAYVVFKKTYWIEAKILDLAVLNHDGSCKLDLKGEYQLPEQLTTGWNVYLRKTIDMLQKAGGAALEKCPKIERLPEESRLYFERLALQHEMAAFSSGLVQIEFAGNRVDFCLRRVARFREPGASRLLKNFTMFLSRDAEMHDFAMT